MENSFELIGYFPGVIGKITTLHAVYYKEHWGLDQSFEAQVSRELSDFTTHFDERRTGYGVQSQEMSWLVALPLPGTGMIRMMPD